MLDPERTRDTLIRITERDEYQNGKEPSQSILTQWWEQLKVWFMEQLAKIFPSIGQSESIAVSIMVVIFVIIGVLIIWAVIYMIRNMIRKRTYRDHIPATSNQFKEQTLQSHLDAAQKQAVMKNYNQACRHLFFALLMYYEEQSILEIRSWKTNWDYFEDLTQKKRGHANRFHELAIQFDEVMYGNKILSAEEYDLFSKNVLDIILQPARNVSLEVGGIRKI